MTVHAIEIAFGSPAYQATLSLRHVILRKPLGLSFDPAELAAEVTEIHVAAYEDSGQLTGCLVLKPLTGDKLKMRQVAVATHVQGTGVGRVLVEASERIARERGFAFMELNARDTAIPFYLRLGYHGIGEPFTEVGIPHLKMGKAL
jgi:predicted GNAT family N-acyltransferase